MFKICTVGCGNMSTTGHGPSYAKYKKDYPDTCLAACCDLDEKKATDYAEKFGFERVYTDYIQMIETEKPDVVCLMSPVDKTCEMSVQIMSRGFNIILEKPPGRNVDELTGMNMAAINANVSVRTAFNRRYTPLITELKKRIHETGEKIINITYQMYRWHRYERDFSTTAIHAVDVVKFIAGSDYIDVKFNYDHRPELGENVKNIFMNGIFKNGAHTQISLVATGGAVTERITVNTHNNTFFVDLPVWGNMDVPGKLVHVKDGDKIETVTGDQLSDSTEMFELCGFYDENRSFFEHLRNGGKRICDLSGCAQSVEIEDCIRNSVESYERKSYIRSIESPFNPPRITPPAEHPRVALREKDFDRIRANMNNPLYAKEFALWKALCEEDFAKYDETLETGAYNSHVCIVLEAKALKALLDNDEEEAKKLVDVILKLCGNYDPESDWLMKARFGGHIVHTVSLCYDWLYKYFSEKQKWEFIDSCERILSTTLEMGYPPSKQSPISSHGTEAQLLRDCLSFSIAVYDEKPDVYNYCAGRLFDEYVPVYKEFFEGGFQLQGPAYGGYRFCFSAWCQLLFEAMCGERIFDACHDNLCESFFYLLRPDGEYTKIGDDFNESKGYGGYTQQNPATVPMFFAHALTGKDNYWNYYANHNDGRFLVPDKYGRDYYSDGSYSEGMLSPSAFFIFVGRTPKSSDQEMHKAKYFGTPAGVTLYKDNETMLLMKIGEYFTTGHDHYDCGQFQIYHKGTLATDSGYYDWFGCEHHYNYAVRTYAHNCVTITDPEKIDIGYYGDFWGRPGVIYDGGQVYINKGYDVPNLDALKQYYKRGVVLSHTESDDLVEISGDLREPYRDSVEKYIRTMSFEPKKMVFTVKDEITAQSENYIKAFHLHCQTEPTIDSDNQFTVYNDKAKLVCTVIEPKNFKIEAIGGKDNEFSLYGVNHKRNEKKLHSDTNANAEHHDEGGWGRITITALDKKKDDNFVVKMEIIDL